MFNKRLSLKKLKEVRDKRLRFQEKGRNTRGGMEVESLWQEAMEKSACSQDAILLFEKAIFISKKECNIVALLRSKFQMANYLLDRPYESSLENIRRSITLAKDCLLYTSPSPRDRG